MNLLDERWADYAAAMRGMNVKNALLSRDGEIVAEAHFDEDCLRNAYSATKSFTATAVGIAQAEGLLSLEERVVDCFSHELPDAPGEHLEQLRVRHLITMTLGQDQAYLMGASRPVMPTKDWVRFALSRPFVEAPGMRFRYTNVGPYLAGLLVARRAGMSLAAYLYERFLDPLGILFPSWEVDPMRNSFGAGGMMVTTWHLLRLGEVYLNGGVWHGRRLLTEAWVAEAQRPFLPQAVDPEKGDYGYGYSFWLGPHGSYQASGKYGQYAVVMPEKNAVLAVTADAPEGSDILGPFWEKVYPAL